MPAASDTLAELLEDFLVAGQKPRLADQPVADFSRQPVQATRSSGRLRGSRGIGFLASFRGIHVGCRGARGNSPASRRLERARARCGRSRCRARARRGSRPSRRAARSARWTTAMRIGCSDWSNSSSGSIGCSPGGLCGRLAISCSEAASATAVPQTCGLTRTPKAFAMSAIFFVSEMPPAAAMSGCRMSTSGRRSAAGNPSG